MPTKIQQLENALDKNQGQKHYVEALVKALGDPSSYSYTGKCYDAGVNSMEYCSCGHSIRYVFIVSDGSKTAKIGSTCINHFMMVNPALYETLKAAENALLEQVKEAQKAAKAAAQDTVASTLDAKRLALRNQINQMLNTNPDAYEDWRVRFLLRQNHPIQAQAYQRKSALIKWQEKQIEGLELIIERMNGDLSKVKVWRYEVQIANYTVGANSMPSMVGKLADIYAKPENGMFNRLPLNYSNYSDTAKVRALIQAMGAKAVKGEQWFLDLGKGYV